MIRSLPILLLLGIVFFGCRRETVVEQRPVDVILQRIGGTWKADVVSLSGVQKSAYRYFTITFTGSPTDDFIYFTTTGRPTDSEFPESGTLKLGENIDNDLLVMPDGWPIVYATSDSQFQFTFTSSRPTPGGQPGDPVVLPIPTWVFSLKR